MSSTNLTDSEMISIIDQEIIDCKVQLQLLRSKLKQYYFQKKINKNKNENKDKSIQTVVDQAIQVNLPTNNLNKSKNDKIIQTDLINSSNLLQLQNNKNREEKYQRKILEIKQQKKQKQTHNVAVETTTTVDPFSNEFEIENIFSNDQTVYLQLPSTKQKINDNDNIDDCTVDDESTSLLFRELLQISSNNENKSMTNITLPSIQEEQSINLTHDHHHIDSDNDHEKFWNDVFKTAGLK